jgi:hypothetical protein
MGSLHSVSFPRTRGASVEAENLDPLRTASGGTPADTTQRNPRLLLQFSGSFRLRFDARRLCALLFHAPPRTTRAPSSGLPLHRLARGLAIPAARGRWLGRISFLR